MSYSFAGGPKLSFSSTAAERRRRPASLHSSAGSAGFDAVIWISTRASVDAL
jgi:hypothetical protein